MKQPERHRWQCWRRNWWRAWRDSSESIFQPREATGWCFHTGSSDRKIVTRLDYFVRQNVTIVSVRDHLIQKKSLWISHWKSHSDWQKSLLWAGDTEDFLHEIWRKQNSVSIISRFYYQWILSKAEWMIWAIYVNQVSMIPPDIQANKK